MSRTGPKAQQRYFESKAAKREELLGISRGLSDVYEVGNLPQSRVSIDSNRILAAIEVMSELLAQQETGRFPVHVKPSARPRYEDSTCKDHLDCQAYKSNCFAEVARVYVFCSSRSYISKGVKYFVVRSCIEESSQILGRGPTECAAWDEAVRYVLAPKRPR